MRNPAGHIGIGKLLSSLVASECKRWRYQFCFIFFQNYEKFLQLSTVSDRKKKKKIFPGWYE